MSFFQSTWFSAAVGGVLYLGMTGVLLRPANLTQKGICLASHDAATETTASWKFYNPEVDRLVAELKQEKAALQTREQQLHELAARLEAERAEINIVTQAVFRLQREFDRNVLRVQEQETANLKKLAKVYATMEPDSAASILKQMEDDQVVKILIFMKEGETAPVLQSFARLGEPEAKRAALISDRLRTAIIPKVALKP